MTPSPEEKPVILHSQKAINITTFFGGPLAAAILMRRNFINLGQDSAGLYAVITGVFATFVIFSTLFFIPEHILDKIPNFVIPAIYTAIIGLIVEKIHGPLLREHKASGKPFYSAWYAAGVGFVCMIILSGAVFGYVLLYPGYDSDHYDNQMTVFAKNETEALELYDMLNAEPLRKVLNFIDNKGIPAWQRNIAIIDELDKMENLPQELAEQNTLLRKYCSLRIEIYELTYKTAKENTTTYDQLITSKTEEIQKIIEKLN